MHLNLKHNLSQTEAVTRVKRALNEHRAELTKQATVEEERWENNILHFAFTAQGQHISGQLEVKDREFVVDAKLPFMLRLFEGRIEREIQKQAGAMLGR